MNVQELLNIVREYPLNAEVLITIDGELLPLTAEHVGVLDGKVVLAPVTEPEAETPKRKSRKAE